MINKNLFYLQEIPNTSWVLETISEQFDNAANMMTENSIIYGGAVRDCLAKKELVGDLDIAVPVVEYELLVSRFTKNPKWIGINSSTLYRQSMMLYNKKRLTFPRILQQVSFKTLGDKVVQITVPETTGDDPFNSAVNLARQVDIVCCGTILTNNGKVFEVVPNAYKDCINTVLHINNISNITDIQCFQQRIEKLLARGWDNKIDINKVSRNITKNINRKNKQKDNKKTDVENIGISSHRGNSIIFEYGTWGTSMYKYSLNEKGIELVGGVQSVITSLGKIAKKYKISMKIEIKNTYISFAVGDKKTSSMVLNALLYGKTEPSPVNTELPFFVSAI